MLFYYFIQIVEIQEAHDFQKGWLQIPENTNNIYVLNEIWNHRKPWIGDNLNVWNDLISWRQTYYSFLIPHNINTKILESALVNIYKFCLYYCFV